MVREYSSSALPPFISSIQQTDSERSSGEFHTYRLPVPDLWLDILQKVKAAGLNAVSVYIHWGSINPNPSDLDFDDWRALQPLFDAAKAAGVFIVLRPGMSRAAYTKDSGLIRILEGPYINAETTAGGLPHWVTSQVAGSLRSNATDYYKSWQPYIQSIIRQTAPNQFSNGGPVIGEQSEIECERS
jgi:beta-galactosidase GanA